MKKIVSRLGIAVGSLAIIIAGGAAFSAFEARVVNVTAAIDNALQVPLELSGMDFGNVFPEEVLHQNLDINLSNSFASNSRVDDVEYMIRQKPKCGIPIPQTNPVQYSGFVQVTDGPNNSFVCPQGSVELPLLCPYLSKNEISTDGTGPENDGQGIAAFHGPLTGWTLVDTIATQVVGKLIKTAGDLSDTWDIDLHVPCFGGHCAQDNTIPKQYESDPAQNGQTFGCDLWVEVFGISLPPNQPTDGTLIVQKVVINDSGTGTLAASDFSFTVNGGASTSFEADGQNDLTVNAGAYTVLENIVSGYNTTYQNCQNVVINGGDTQICVITNDDIPPPTGNLTVVKQVVGSNADPNSFSLFVDGSPVTNGVGISTSPGNHTVTETVDPDYTLSFSGDCNPSGVVNVSLNGSVQCNVINTRNTGQITVVKVVQNNGVGSNVAGDFQLQIDGNDVAQDSAVSVVTGSHTVSEPNSLGYVVSFSGDCDSSGTVNVGNNESKTCTVTNTQLIGTITVTKNIVNNNGGNAVVTDFNFFVDSTGVSSGVAQNFAPGTYTVGETGVFGYQASFSGDCNPSTHEITIAAGESKTCIITNDDMPSTITLVKSVINNNSGTATPSSFIMRVDGTPVPHGSSISVSANANHTIIEDAKPGYTNTGVSGLNCPGSLPGIVNLGPGQSISCTITNDDN